MSSNYATCSGAFPDPSTQLPQLLECISDADTAGRADLAAGLDSLFLIFAGALV
jgi:hypothetical protein